MSKHLFLAFSLGVAVALPPLLPQAQESSQAQEQRRSGAAQSQIVNINAADAEAISQALVGVGHTRARAIVEYRDEFGPFFSAEDLLEVKGIGPSTLERNRNRITLE